MRVVSPFFFTLLILGHPSFQQLHSSLPADSVYYSVAYAPSEPLLPTTTEEIPLLSPNVVAVLKEEARKLEILTATIKLMIDMRYIDTIKGYLYRKSQNLLKATRLQIAMVAQNQN